MNYFSFLKLDSRSLSLARILIGLILIVDILDRWFLGLNFFGSNSILPYQIIAKQSPQTTVLNFHRFFNSSFSMNLLYFVHFIIAILFTLGWKTRLTSILLWAFQISLFNYNPIPICSGDKILNNILYFLPFLPMGEHFVFFRSKKTKETPFTVSNWASIAIYVQIASLYIFTALQKNDPAWLPNGSALKSALYLEAFTLPLGIWMRSLPSLVLKMGTIATWILELLAPVGLLFLRSEKLKTYIIYILIVFHITLLVTLSLGVFQYKMIACLVLLLPSFFWNFLKNKNVKKHVNLNIRETSQFICLTLVFLILFQNLTTLDLTKRLFRGNIFIGYVLRATSFLGLENNWNMFAPYPVAENGWYEVKVTDNNNIEHWLPLSSQSELSLKGQKPKSVKDHYGDQRWKFFFFYLHRPPFKFTYNSVASYYCRLAKKNLSMEINHVEILYHFTKIIPGNEEKSLNATPKLKKIISLNCASY